MFHNKRCAICYSQFTINGESGTWLKSEGGTWLYYKIVNLNQIVFLSNLRISPRRIFNSHTRVARRDFISRPIVLKTPDTGSDIGFPLVSHYHRNEYLFYNIHQI